MTTRAKYNMPTGTSVLGRKKSVLGKLVAVLRERHVFSAFFEGDLPDLLNEV